jgi:ribonuclease HI
MGLIEGLKKAIELNITDLFVEGDSMLVIKQMKGDYKVSSESLKILHAMARDLELKFEIISYNHIYWCHYCCVFIHNLFWFTSSKECKPFIASSVCSI